MRSVRIWLLLGLAAMLAGGPSLAGSASARLANIPCTVTHQDLAALADAAEKKNGVALRPDRLTPDQASAFCASRQTIHDLHNMKPDEFEKKYSDEGQMVLVLEYIKLYVNAAEWKELDTWISDQTVKAYDTLKRTK
jgi:hypothetical protein